MAMVEISINLRMQREEEVGDSFVTVLISELYCLPHHFEFSRHNNEPLALSVLDVLRNRDEVGL